MKTLFYVFFISIFVMSIVFANESMASKNIIEALQKSQKLEGLFTIYKQKNKYYLEIPTNKLNKDYFVSLQISKGISVYPFLGGLTIPVFGYSDYTQVVYFDSPVLKEKNELKEGEVVDVNFYVKNLKYRASFDDASQKLLQKSFSDNLLLKTKGIYSSGKIYINLNEFAENLDLSLNSFPAKLFKISFESLENVKNYPKNTILYFSYLVSFGKGRIDADFMSNGLGRYLNSLNLLSSNEVVLALNIFEYEDKDYKPRQYDDRVGYFATTFSDVSSVEGKDGGYRTIKKYINRWNIENGKKIKIWIENTWPEEYRETVKEAVLEWNKAFNKIGYDNPIEVDVQPYNSEWEPEDIRYSTIRYQDASLTAFAIGPSIALPTTGQIVDADVVFYAPMLRLINFRFDTFFDTVLPSAIKYQTNPLYRISKDIMFKYKDGLTLPELYSFIMDGLKDNNQSFRIEDVCTYQMEKAEYSALALTALMISDPMNFNLNKEKFAKDYVKDVIIHEVGHILGLRHNFKASSFVTIDQLRDKSYTSANGIAYSCMDYNPPNIHCENGKPYIASDVFMTTIGKYDYMAIEYGYTKDESKLKSIAAKAGIYYGPDEDVFALDPNIRRWDLSSESYKWNDNFAQSYKYVIDNAPYKLSKTGTNPNLIYWLTQRGLDAYIDIKIDNLIYYLAGKHINRTFFGDYNVKNVDLLDKKQQEYIMDTIINDLKIDKPLINQDVLQNSILFGSYEWGSTSYTTLTLFDDAYYSERIYRLLSMLVLILPVSPQYEYYYDQETVSKNIRKIYLALTSDIKFNKDISQIRQQSIEDFIYLLLFINGYTKFNSKFDIIFLNLIYLPNSRNQAFETLEKLKSKLEGIKNNPLSTRQNKLFANRMLKLIEVSINN